MSRRPGALALSFIAAGAALSLEARAQQARSTTGAATLSLTDAIATALKQSPDALAAAAQVDQAEAARVQARGGLLPRLHVDAAVQQWNSPFDLQFGGAEFRVRDAFTWSVTPSLIQPLTPLFTTVDQYKARELGVDVAVLQRQVARREAAFRTATAYFRLLEAERLAEVADASVTQLASQAREAQSRLDNGLIGKNDLLRATLALATARQRAIQMRGTVTLAHGELATAMGVPVDTPLEPAPVGDGATAAEDGDLATAEARAATQRPEVRALEVGVSQAQADLRGSRARLLPQVNAVASYTHFIGSAFQQQDASYVGLVAAWDVWDWGATIGDVQQAGSRLDQAGLARRKLEDAVRLEARKAFVDAATAREALGVARAAVEQAEENYRIVTKKVESNAATSFDQVDAEALLTQARGQVQTALYDYLIAKTALARATGTPLPGES